MVLRWITPYLKEVCLVTESLLVHLGYLTYHEGEKTVQIPNEEVKIGFRQFLRGKI